MLQNVMEILKTLGYKSIRSDNDIIVLNTKGENIHNTPSVANMFNDSFSNVVSQLVSKLPMVLTSSHCNLKPLNSFLRITF